MREAGGSTWYKGDIHYHEVKQVPVAETIPMLQELGYDFVILEYKDMEPVEMIPPEGSLSRSDFLVIAGAEQAFRSRAEKFAHLSIAPLEVPFRDSETDYWHIPDGFDRINERVPGALVRINHPADERWTLQDIGDAVTRGARMFELNPTSPGGTEGALKLWDEALAQGMLLFGALSSDIHHIITLGRTGWIEVCASELAQQPVLEAMRSGEFVAVEPGCAAQVSEVYRGSGAAGSHYRVTADGAATVRFIGRGGAELSRVAAPRGCASYAVRGGELYVRAEIADAEGRRVFTQPVMAPVEAR